jgi:hypothetical protein
MLRSNGTPLIFILWIKGTLQRMLYAFGAVKRINYPEKWKASLQTDAPRDSGTYPTSDRGRFRKTV